MRSSGMIVTAPPFLSLSDDGGDSSVEWRNESVPPFNAHDGLMRRKDFADVYVVNYEEITHYSRN